MLEIIALIYFTRKMGELAERKGQKKSAWKLYTVLTWFGAEIFGAVLSVFITSQVGVSLLVAYGFAVGSYFMLRSILAKKPNIPETSFEFEQQPADLK
jgi:hypothetical protein